MNKPRLLDLFCGAGGCSVGYARAGFDVVGVDIKPQPRYPFAFVQADAIDFARWIVRRDAFEISSLKHYELSDFDCIHASPPCQKYSMVNRRQHMQGRSYPDLVDATRELLISAQKPWVIENVPGAPLPSSIQVCGSYFGLPIRRHRRFESSCFLWGTPCRHGWQKEKKYPTCFQEKGAVRRKSAVVQCYGNTQGVGLWPAALGIDWMNRKEMSQAIPPAYTYWIGCQLMVRLGHEPRKWPQEEVRLHDLQSESNKVQSS